MMARVKEGWRTFRALMPFLATKILSLKMKGQVYSDVARNVGPEGGAEMLDRVEMRIIRWMCSISMRERMMSAGLRWMMGEEVVADVVWGGRTELVRTHYESKSRTE